MPCPEGSGFWSAPPVMSSFNTGGGGGGGGGEEQRVAARTPRQRRSLRLVIVSFTAMARGHVLPSRPARTRGKKRGRKRCRNHRRARGSSVQTAPRKHPRHGLFFAPARGSARPARRRGGSLLDRTARSMRAPPPASRQPSRPRAS